MARIRDPCESCSSARTAGLLDGHVVRKTSWLSSNVTRTSNVGVSPTCMVVGPLIATPSTRRTVKLKIVSSGELQHGTPCPLGTTSGPEATTVKVPKWGSTKPEGLIAPTYRNRPVLSVVTPPPEKGPVDSPTLIPATGPRLSVTVPATAQGPVFNRTTGIV